MRDAITEQPTVLRAVLEAGPEVMQRVIHSVGPEAQRLYLIGSGTSYNAAVAVMGLIRAWTDLDVTVVAPHEFLHYEPQTRLGKGTLAVGISQSGRSTGTLDSLKHARDLGAVTIAVTAEADSPITAVAGVTIPTSTGPEPVGPKTKGYTSTVATLLWLVAGLAEAKGYASGHPADEVRSALKAAPGVMEETLTRCASVMADIIATFAAVPSLSVVSYGPNLATALEGGLKILETVRVPVGIFEAEEYMHGPYHCLEPETHAVFIVPSGPGQARAMDLIRFVQTLTTRTLVLTDEANEGARSLSGHVIMLPGGLAEGYTPLSYIVPLQLLANDLTIARGRRPETSRHPQFHATLGSKL